MPFWVRALTREDDALFWAVHDCLRSCEGVTDRELKVKAFARTYRTATALLGVVLIAFGLWQKARMEEGFLTAELGADAYGPYCRRVPMLVPFLPQG